jgi:GNAT superfamily N-acetyltransferase
VELRAAKATDVYKFQYLATPDADDATDEVERWVRQSAWSWYRDPLGTSEDRRLLVADGDDGLAAVVAHHRYQPGSRYLMVILLDHELRGAGAGTELWEAAVEDASQDGAAFWRVREGNDAALHLSRKVADREAPPQDGYVTFLVDRHLGTATS